MRMTDNITRNPPLVMTKPSRVDWVDLRRSSRRKKTRNWRSCLFNRICFSACLDLLSVPQFSRVFLVWNPRPRLSWSWSAWLCPPRIHLGVYQHKHRLPASLQLWGFHGLPFWILRGIFNFRRLRLSPVWLWFIWGFQFFSILSRVCIENRSLTVPSAIFFLELFWIPCSLLNPHQ